MAQMVNVNFKMDADVKKKSKRKINGRLARREKLCHTIRV